MNGSRIAAALMASVVFAAPAGGAEFASDWDTQHDRVWIGPEYWANPLENWRLSGGRLECIGGPANQSVHLLTHQVGEQPGTLEMSVVVGLIGDEGEEAGSGQQSRPPRGSVGFEVGIRSQLGDYRSSLIRGSGVRVALTSDAEVLVGGANGQPGTVNFDKADDLSERLRTTGLLIKWLGEPTDDGYTLAFRIHDPGTGELLTVAGLTSLRPEDVVGNIALVHNPRWGGGARGGRGPRSAARFWFRDWRVSGARVTANPDRAFGPILYAMHTLSRGVMKMTAQMPPVGADDDQTVVLQVPLRFAEELLRVPGVESTAPPQNEAADEVLWTPIARANIDPLSCTAHFRIPHWADTEDVPYRLVYTMRTKDGSETEHEFTGTVRKDPVDKPTISVAGFTGHKDTAFPNQLLVSNVLKHDPDVCLFTGDQIYEDAGGFGIIREPADRAVLNYLRKIWLWGWSFRDVLRDRPSFVLPDDHDVYQGNVWGEGGKPTREGMADHDAGGFAEPPDFVNAVFRTQCGHHPDPYDPTPMMQGIDCWYGDCVYGRISFAIIEDRYFKSGPAGKVNEWPGRPDHVKDPDYDTSRLDKPGLVLLGERQLAFLNEWAADWRGADMKCVGSQTIFCNLANYHGAAQEFIYADLDSNGWPQTGRNRAVDAMRKGFAFHYAGDQHLPSIVHHGIDTWRDANWSFCVPSTAAGYPRSWRPDQEGRPVQGRPEPGLPNTGDYRDAFGNFITVYGVGNPERMNRRPVLELLHDKSSGYGLVHFNKPERTITMECFKLIFDAANPQPEDQFPGWPRTISMLDNDGREPSGHLPAIEVRGMSDPVVQVVDESTGEIAYTLRISGTSFRPHVFSEGPFTVRVGELDENEQRLEGMQPVGADSARTVTVDFQPGTRGSTK